MKSKLNLVSRVLLVLPWEDPGNEVEVSHVFTHSDIDELIKTRVAEKFLYTLSNYILSKY